MRLGRAAAGRFFLLALLVRPLRRLARRLTGHLLFMAQAGQIDVFCGGAERYGFGRHGISFDDVSGWPGLR